MLRLRVGSAVALGLLVVGCPLACGQSFSAASAGDGGADGTAGNDGAPGDQVSPDGSEAAGPGHIVYVSTAGSDSNDGRDPTMPKQTIAQALQRAQSIMGVEVHVCAGVYPESGLTLAQSIPLLGGYNCTTWVRTATYGYPTFDKSNVTTIQNKDPGVQPATLIIADGVTSAGKVDGFTIAGASSFAGTTFGVETLGSAAPLLSNDGIDGGGGTGTGSSPGSVGVVISSGSPEVASCFVSGGTGTGPVGSAGMAISTTGMPNVHDDTVSGGTGTTNAAANGLAAVGISVASTMTNASALRSLLVAGADPSGVVGTSIGILIGGSNVAVDVDSSYIEGGIGTGASTLSAGVEIDSAGATVRLVADHIYGGARSGTSSAAYAVFAVSSGPLDVHDCEIHAGTATGTGTGTSTIAAQIVAATSPSFVEDTIYTGAGFGLGLSLYAGVTGVVVQDVLFAGGDPQTGSIAISAANCSGQFMTLDHSAFVNFEAAFGCQGLSTVTSSPDIIATLTGAGTTGDFVIPSPPGCEAGCVSDGKCPGAPGTCLPSIFGASWTSDDGITGLFDGAPTGTDAGAMFAGWTLPASALCALAHGGTPISSIPKDIFGQTRSTTAPTIGAFEDTMTGCSP